LEENKVVIFAAALEENLGLGLKKSSLRDWKKNKSSTEIFSESFIKSERYLKLL